MIDPETLLQPVSSEHPCGEDVSYDAKYLGLDTLIVGKPETQFSASEEPNWKDIRETCVELFGRSKHLRVATLLCLALVKMEGATGLRDGLSLVKGLLEKYWADLFPKLDPADDNDPLERVNIISSLSRPLATYGDPIRFLERVRRMPLVQLPRVGPVCMADLAGDKPAGAESQAPTISPAQIKGAMRDAAPAEIEATYAALSESILLVRAIDDFLTRTVGAHKAPDMDVLLVVLGEIQKGLSPFVKNTALDLSAGEAGTAAAVGGQEGQSSSGVIASRRDVLRALDQICEYYAHSESSSPVPLLLQRARRLVDMDFVQIVNDLAPEALGQINVVTGYRSGDGAEGSGSSESA